MTQPTQTLYRNSNGPYLYRSDYRDGNAPGTGGYAPVLGTGTVYHVAKTGNDSNFGTSEAAAFLTINKAISVASAPGSTIQVHAGVYLESTQTSPHVTPVSGAAVAAYTSGTVGNPITLMAYPGDEGLVDIDGGGTLCPLQLNSKSYWQIWGLRFVNGETYGINNFGQPENEIADDNLLSKSVLIENCLVKNIVGNWGDNISGIGPWSTKDWVIRNCRVRNVSARPPPGPENPTVTSAVQWYQAINLLIENIDCDTQYGISAKDHFMAQVTPSRITTDGMTARYNRLKTSHAGVRVSIRGANTPEAGDQEIYNNIIFGLQNANAEGGIVGFMDGATGQSKRLSIRQNTIDMTSATGAPYLEVQNMDDVEVYGNVGVGSSLNLSIDYGNNGFVTLLTQCDYNIYTAAQWILDRYGPSSASYNSLASFQALASGAKPTLAVSNPELHSLVSASTNFFNNLAGNDYTPKAGGNLIGFMPGSLNAGAYENGTEVIGLLSTYSAGV